MKAGKSEIKFHAWKLQERTRNTGKGLSFKIKNIYTILKNEF